MKAQLGRPSGLALVLLSTLLATFLAMGVFSVAQANHSATRSFSATTVQAGATDPITVTITLREYQGSGVVRDELQGGFSFVPDSSRAFSDSGQVTSRVVDNSDTHLDVAFDRTDIKRITYMVTAPSDAGGSDPPAFAGKFVDVTGEEDIGGTPTVTVTADATGGNGEAESEDAVSSREPGANVRIELSLNAEEAIPAGDDFTVGLGGFSLPDSIANTAVLISSAGYTGSPAEVLIGSNGVVTISLYSRWPGGAQAESIQGAYTVTFKQSAGIDNSAAAGNITITVSDNDETDHEVTHMVQRVIKLSKGSGTRGTMTTATFKGFADGSATVYLNAPESGDKSESKLAEVMITDNLGEYEIDTSDSDFKANQDNKLTAVDSGGVDQDKYAKFIISPKVTLDPAETEVSKDVTVKLSDWVADDTIAAVAISGVSVTPTSTSVKDGKAEFKITVPSNANRGTQTVKVTGTANAFGSDKKVEAKATLNIGVLALSAQPAMVVPGQQITIQGSGFVANDSFDKVVVGGIDVAISGVTASSAGDIVITINVPSPSGDDSAGIGSGKKTISVTATGSNRVAEGEIEIPKAAITLDPETSRRGTTVNVSGSGFPSGDLVQVKYDNNGTSVTVAAGSADASGAVSIDFVVPSYARIGTKHDVAATSVGVYAGVTANSTHETPGAMVTLSTQQIASGQNITISGMNFPAFATVAVMEIGGVDVRPVPAPATSINGDFESTVLVPQLELGNQTVSIRVSSTTITTFLELATVAVATAPADVFGGLGDRLVRVWFLDRATQQWSFYDPDPEVAAFNTLTEVTGGQIVTIIISEGDSVGFQGGTLFAGSNPVSLN